MIEFEIYKGNHNKTYLVTATDNDPEELRKIARARFKVSNKKIMVCGAWIKGDELYLDYPYINGMTRVWTAYKMEG